jgi:hypothetical protein
VETIDRDEQFPVPAVEEPNDDTNVSVSILVTLAGILGPAC